MANPVYTSLKPDQSGTFPHESGVSLYYELRGEKNGTKVVMLMGCMATCKHFEELADHLAAKYQVLIFNHRGVGQGEKESTIAGVPRGQTSAMLADDTVALMDHLWGAQTKVHVFGASMGGWVAQTFGQLLLKEWTDNHDEYFTSRDLDASAAQVGLCVRHKLTGGDAKRLRECHVPIMVPFALHDKVMKPSAQQELAKVLGAATLVTECGPLLSSECKMELEAAWEKLH